MEHLFSIRFRFHRLNKRIRMLVLVYKFILLTYNNLKHYFLLLDYLFGSFVTTEYGLKVVLSHLRKRNANLIKTKAWVAWRKYALVQDSSTSRQQQLTQAVEKSLDLLRNLLIEMEFYDIRDYLKSLYELLLVTCEYCSFFLDLLNERFVSAVFTID